MHAQHPVPDELLKHIGDVTVSFAMLEGILQMLAQSLLGAGQRLGQIVTAELSFKALRALTVSLYVQRNGQDEPYHSEFRSLIKRLADTEEQRNQIVHSVWCAGNSPTTITRFKTTAKERYGIRSHFEDVSSEQLSTFAMEIKILAAELQQFCFKLLDSGKATNG
jgi:hypothetical protein